MVNSGTTSIYLFLLYFTPSAEYLPRASFSKFQNHTHSIQLMPALLASFQPHTATMETSVPFTCNACLLSFESSAPQRTHMHQDWQ